MKKGIIGLAALVGIVVIAALVAPKEFKVERDIIILKPKEAVFGHLKLLRNHDEWNAWSKKDSKMKKEFRGTDGTVGFTSSWSGNSEVGTGEQEIINITEGQKIESQIRMTKPFQASFNTYLSVEEVAPNQTKVTMGMTDTMAVPFNLICLVTGQAKKIARDTDDSLSNMKFLLEGVL